MTFFYWLQIFISVSLIIMVLFQRSSSDGIISSSVNANVASNAGSLARKITVFLILCFFLNCLYLASDQLSKQHSKQDLIGSLDGQSLAEEDRDSELNAPVLN